MKNPRGTHPDTAGSSTVAGSRRRRRSPVAAMLVPFCLAILAGCYQTPDLVDPLKWADKAMAEFDAPANQMERHLFDGQVPGADGTPGKIQQAKAEPPAAKMVLKPSDPPLAAPSAGTSAVTPPPFDIPRNPAAATAVTSPREREVLRELMDATGDGDDKPTRVTDVAAQGDGPIALAPQGKKMEPAGDVVHGREFAVHLASYREMRNLRNDWKRMVKRYPEFLLGLKARVATVDLGPAKGTFHRLKAGPLPSRKFARRLCKSLRARGLYCAVMRFSGRQLATVQGTPGG